MEDFIILWIKVLLYPSVFLNIAATVTDKLQTVAVCPGEQQTTLTCSTNHIFLEWNVSSFMQTEPRSISNIDQIVVIPPIIMMDSAKFTFSRVSSPGTLPLVSTMIIMNVTNNLEGTVISCSGQSGSSVSTVVLTTIIHVYDMDVDFPNAPQVISPDNVIRFGNNNFTVTLEWSQCSGESYSVTTVPEPVNMSSIMSNSVQLVLLYDTEYNVTITAMLCGNSNATNFTTLSYYYGLTQVPHGQSTNTSTAITTDSYETITSSHSQSITFDGPLLGSLIGVSIAIIMSLVSIIIVIIIIFKRRGIHLKTIKINMSSDNSMNSQHCEADKTGTLVYAEVFSSSLIRPKHQFAENQTPELFDDRVNYAEVNHNLISATQNAVNSEIDHILNLDNLLIHIKWDTTQVWYQLGEALGIEKKILDKFTTCSPEEAIIEMLDYWLRNHTGKPTWKEVADALRKIHLHKLASGLEAVH